MEAMKKKIISILIIVMTAMGLMTLAPAPVFAADSYNCSSHFLGLRAWYDGLTGDKCEMKNPESVFGSDASDAVSKYVWKIVLNCVSMVLGIAGYLAIGLVIWGGILYVISQGDPVRAAKGKKTVQNSVIGLAIVMTGSIISGAISDIIKGAKDKGNDFFLEIFNQAFLWGGILAVIMIVWGGIQYVISVGSPEKISKAKNTILYAAIGLLIVIFAATIVNTVVGAL